MWTERCWGSWDPGEMSGRDPTAAEEGDRDNAGALLRPPAAVDDEEGPGFSPLDSVLSIFPLVPPTFEPSGPVFLSARPNAPRSTALPRRKGCLLARAFVVNNGVEVEEGGAVNPEVVAIEAKETGVFDERLLVDLGREGMERDLLGPRIRRGGP
jgi:hypothetical protein